MRHLQEWPRAGKGRLGLYRLDETLRVVPSSDLEDVELEGFAGMRAWRMRKVPNELTAMLIDPARLATSPGLLRLGRYIQPGDSADLVAFMLGRGGRSIIGQRLVVGAGASL